MPLPEEEELVTSDDLDALGIVPEYVANAPDNVREINRLAAIDYVLSFLGRRAKRPVTDIDHALKKAMAIRWYEQIARFIGYPPSEGADEQFKAAVDANESWLKLVREGNVEPWFEDSTPDVAEFGPRGGTSETADAWVDP